jgi:hypothetical protein
VSEEIWKDVIEFEGIYKVSNKGEVTSLDRISEGGKRLKGKRLKLRKRTLSRRENRETMNHNTVSLYKNGIQISSASVGRLVLMAFDRLPKETEVVVYKDGDCTNECFENLEWGYRTGLSDDVRLEIRELIKDAEFSINQIAEAYNVSERTVYKIKNGEFKHRIGD